MAKPTIKIVNAETGEEIEREMNAAEFAQWNADNAAEAEKLAAKATMESEKAALLSKLGITAQEAALLLS
jgi:hypothetical protein